MKKLIIILACITLLAGPLGCATTQTSKMSTADQIAAMEADQKARRVFKIMGYGDRLIIINNKIFW